MSKKHSKPNKKTRQARHSVEQESTQDLIITINYLLGVLKSRGVKIPHFDRRNEYLQYLQIFKQKPYFLTSTEKEESEVTEE